MRSKVTLKLVAALAALALVAGACGSDDEEGGAGGTTEAAGDDGGSTAEFAELGGWDDGPCDDAKPTVKVGGSNPIETAGLNLGDYADGVEAAVEAFNARGGINGSCMEVEICDGKGDGPTELACARGFAEDDEIVAGLASTYTASEAEAFQLFESTGLPQIGSQPTQPGGWNSALSYEWIIGAGGLLANIPALDSVGVEKFVAFFPASGRSASFTAFSAPVVKALGMEQTEIIEIPATAVEFSQFVLQGKESGAGGVLLGLPGNVAGQVIDAMDSLGSDLKLSVTLGTFSKDGVEEVPEQIAKAMAFSDSLPPITGDPERWPIMDVIAADLEASGKPNLKREATNNQALHGWLSVYTLAKVMREAEATEITRATVKDAFDKATDIDMFDLMDPWTPSKQSSNAIFKGIANPKTWTGSWDGEQFVMDEEQVDVLALLGS